MSQRLEAEDEKKADENGPSTSEVEPPDRPGTSSQVDQATAERSQTTSARTKHPVNKIQMHNYDIDTDSESQRTDEAKLIKQRRKLEREHLARLGPLVPIDTPPDKIALKVAEAQSTSKPVPLRPKKVELSLVNVPSASKSIRKLLSGRSSLRSHKKPPRTSNSLTFVKTQGEFVAGSSVASSGIGSGFSVVSDLPNIDCSKSLSSSNICVGQYVHRTTSTPVLYSEYNDFPTAASNPGSLASDTETVRLFEELRKSLMRQKSRQK